MSTTTYELATTADGAAILRCLLCGGESSDAESVQRFHCSHCRWFHEPLEEDQLDLLRHTQTAAGEVQVALDMAERLSDTARAALLRSALRDLRLALSRV